MALRPAIVHTHKSKYLCDLLNATLGFKLVPVLRKHIEGESYYRLVVAKQTALLGRDVVVVSSLVDDTELLDLFQLGDTLARMGTRPVVWCLTPSRRVFVVPYLLYETMDRAVLPGEVVGCKATARLLSRISSLAYGNFFVFMDLSSRAIVHYFERCQTVELSADRALCAAIAEHIRPSRDVVLPDLQAVFATTDLLHAEAVEAFALCFGCSVAVMRQLPVTVFGLEAREIIGDVAGRHVVIYDNLLRSGKTLLAAAECYRAHGAARVSAVVTHFVATKSAVVGQLEASCLDVLLITNSHTHSQGDAVAHSPKIRVVDITPVFLDQLLSMVGPGGRSSIPNSPLPPAY